MQKTSIEWVKNPNGTQGYTWNPITGCLNGCEYCYARKLANGRLKKRYLANQCLAPRGKYPLSEGFDPFYPRFWIDRAREEFGSCHVGAIPKGIFVCDMSDLFGIGVPEEWTRRILNKIGMSYYREHRFYLLTKQPQNLVKFSPFPDNCWVGVTATNADMLFDAINHLDDIQCKVRYVSLEPMLASCYLVDLAAHLGSSVDWVIIGAQTKSYKPPKIEWVEEIVRACDKAGIAVFLKDNLRPLLENDHRTFMDSLYWKDGYYTSPEHPNIDLYLRQEMPSEHRTR